MKIAQVVGTFPPDIGGMGQVVFDEATELAKRGHDVTVFCLAFATSRYNDATFPFAVQRLKPFIASGNGGLVVGLYKALNGFDIIHLHYPFYGGAEWVWLRKILQKQKYVVTYHMDAAPTKLSQWVVKVKYDFLFSKAILRNAERVLFVDDEQSQKLSLRRKVSPNKVSILPNGVDTATLQPQTVSVQDFALDDLAGKPIFLFVGNLLKVKGLDLLLRAWNKLKNKEATLLVVGGGYDESKFRKLADELELGARVRWLGATASKEQLAKFYSLATATIVPSYSESFSLVAAEAAACGSPVIGSDIPGIRTRIVPHKTGLLFQSKSVSSLVEAIEQVLKFPETERKQWGLAGRELITNHFSLEKHVDGLEKIYQTV